MTPTLFLLFALAAALLVALFAVIWRVWGDYVNRSREEAELERDLASLNDAQANRVSDTQLTRPVDADAAWQEMVRRGASQTRGKRRPPRR